MEILGQIGLVMVLGLGAVGSALGIEVAGKTAAGAWARQGRMGEPLSFNYIILLGMPISQTLYAMILMRKMVLKYERTVQDDDTEIWDMRLRGEDDVYRVVNPQMGDREERSGKQSVE